LERSTDLREDAGWLGASQGCRPGSADRVNGSRRLGRGAGPWRRRRRPEPPDRRVRGGLDALARAGDVRRGRKPGPGRRSGGSWRDRRGSGGPDGIASRARHGTARVPGRDPSGGDRAGRRRRREGAPHPARGTRVERRGRRIRALRLQGPDRRPVQGAGVGSAERAPDQPSGVRRRLDRERRAGRSSSCGGRFRPRTDGCLGGTW